jgi:hypothetical protein
MNLRDPNRPRSSSNLPMLTWEGKPVCILPTVMIFPLLGEKPGWHITISTCYKLNVARNYMKRVYDTDSSSATQLLGEEMAAWESDPEEYLRSLGWKWEDSGPAPVTAAKPKITLTLEDIGL